MLKIHYKGQWLILSTIDMVEFYRMTQQSDIEKYYLTLIEFLLLSKKSLIEIGARSSLSSMQVLTLMLLSHPRPMNSFKIIFNCDASNITGIIDSLEHKGLVSRFNDNHDRRIKLIKLESKGANLRNRFIKQLTDKHSYIIGKLTPAEVKTFTTLLKKVIAEFEID